MSDLYNFVVITLVDSSLRILAIGLCTKVD